MAEQSDSTTKAPKSSYKQLDELAQKHRVAVKCEYETHVEGFKALLRLGEETYIGIGSNKTSAKDHAAEAALEIWSVKSTPEKKPQEKTPVTTLNEYCQKYKIISSYEELDQDGELFACQLTLIYKKENGVNGEEEVYKGTGKSKKEAKHDSAFNALQRSYILQSVRGETVAPLSSRCYERKPAQSGYVLIVYFTKERKWAEKDETNIKEFMENVLRFQCDVVKDPTKDQLMRLLEGTADHLNRSSRNYYCFTLFIMGHGSSFGINTADKGKKKTISVEDILSHFKNDKIPEFTGKPKAFFIQCCRGGEHQETVVQPDDDRDDENDKVQVPTDGDVYIAHATTEGYKSYRHKAVGSVFIYNCMNIFEKNYSSMHIEEMMIDVRAVIALDPRWQRTKDSKLIAQMPCSWSTLTKRFYLIPACNI
ncbi:caspase-14-like isoform X2 [Crassostrea virginica]|uniref:Caspase-14-like isoform X2 n=1 Tax=Crassostrea virginica TaxID=6565 RepID=A0A8B8B392_CRAVI|nr:caspase-14-like isoform X2 [Crassostrea virginica]